MAGDWSSKVLMHQVWKVTFQGQSLIRLNNHYRSSNQNSCIAKMSQLEPIRPLDPILEKHLRQVSPRALKPASFPNSEDLECPRLLPWLIDARMVPILLLDPFSNMPLVMLPKHLLRVWSLQALAIEIGGTTLASTCQKKTMLQPLAWMGTTGLYLNRWFHYPQAILLLLIQDHPQLLLRSHRIHSSDLVHRLASIMDLIKETWLLLHVTTLVVPLITDAQTLLTLFLDTPAQSPAIIVKTFHQLYSPLFGIFSHDIHSLYLFCLIYQTVLAWDTLDLQSDPILDFEKVLARLLFCFWEAISCF